MRNLSLLLLAACVVTAQTTLAATPDEIRAALAAKFELTQRSKFTGRVTKPGTVLVIQRPGINADPETKLIMKPVLINRDKVEGAGGGSLVGGESGRTLKPGDRVYVYELRPGSDDVVLIYGTVDSYDVVADGGTRSMSYKGSLAFQYPEGTKAVDAARIADDVSLWLKTEAESATSSLNTVKLGQTPEEVAQILGAPEKKIDLGAKKIFVYKDMKIVFVDGKVTDVQ